MKRGGKKAVYRLDPIRHAMNPGKEAKVRALLAVWRQVAAMEASRQWRCFFETGAFETTGPRQFAEHVTARQHQMIRDQVVAQLQSWFGNRQNEYTFTVARSELPDEMRHQLHFINRWSAWFSRAPLAMKVRTEIPAETRVLARRIMRRVMAQHRRPRYGRLSMVIDARGVEVQDSTSSTEFPLWLRLMTLTPRERIHIPLRLHRYATERAGERSCMVQVAERPDGQLVFGLVTNQAETFRDQRKAYKPLVDELGLDFGLRTLFGTDKGDLLGRGFLTHLSKLDRRISSRGAHLQRMGRRPRSSARYQRDVTRIRGFISSEVNRVLNTIIDRDRPAHLVLEYLRFQAPELSRQMNRLLQNCGRRAVEAKLKDIEQQYGVTSTLVPAAYSSQSCSACTYVDARNRDGEKFDCLWCHTKCHADVNAARVIKGRRSVPIGPRYAAKAEVLQECVNRFLVRHPQPRLRRSGSQGGPADPRLSNPYFGGWAASVTSMLPHCTAG